MCLVWVVFFIISSLVSISLWGKMHKKSYQWIDNVILHLLGLNTISWIRNVRLLAYLEVDLLRKMLQKQPELRISAAEALKHPYFTDSDDKIYVPKILMKQSGSCPIELISNENEAAVKFVTIGGKSDKKESIVRTYDRSTIKRKIEQIDVNKLLLNAWSFIIS